jgi:hypothetical protein
MVRVCPPVSGTRSGQGASRVVPGRNHMIGAVSGGMKWKVSGPNPHPSPRTSKASVHSTAFCRTIGSVHQVPISDSPPRPGVVAAMIAAPPTTYPTIFST